MPSRSRNRVTGDMKLHRFLDSQNDLPRLLDLNGRQPHFLHPIGHLQEQEAQGGVRVPLGGHVESVPDCRHEAHHAREEMGVDHLP